MESRKVTIINNRTQSQKVLNNSTATTLGELKSEMRAQGINYEGMTFYEGHIRAELKDDASILPTNIPYKGQVTNDLVFMLTTPEKKIKSGTMSRKEAYTAIKENNFQDKCEDIYGKNFTRCKTQELIELIEAEAEVAEGAPKKLVQKAVVNATTDEEVTKECESEVKVEVIIQAFNHLLDLLEEDEVLYSSDVRSVREMLEETESSVNSEDKLSRDEINDMFDFVD